MYSEEELREKAKNRATEKIGFYTNLVVYLVMNTMFVLIWYLTGGGYPWFVWIMGFWGLGLVIHGIMTFAHTNDVGKNLTKNIEEKEYEKLKRQ